MAVDTHTDVVDADVVEEERPEVTPAPTAAAVVPQAGNGTLAVSPNVEAGELVDRLAVIKDAMEHAMVEGVDYGLIPGAQKPSLFKPGAEKLGVLFQLDIQVDCEKTWGPADHLTVEAKAIVYHAPTLTRLGSGEGLCTTREKKYGKRQAGRACPECGSEQIRKSKHPPRDNPGASPGWYCWSKQGGCAANFDAEDSRITSQQAGEIDNPDMPDTWNTVIKMAKKRAQVDAVLNVTGASALFTQDLEDQVGDPPASDSAPAAEAGPAHGPDTNGEVRKNVLSWVQLVLERAGVSPDNSRAIAADALKAVTEKVGYFPEAAAHAAIAVGKAVQESTPTPGETVPDGPPTGSVERPALTGDTEQDLAAFKAAGCTCRQPLIPPGTQGAGFNELCPLQGHGIPF